MPGICDFVWLRISGNLFLKYQLKGGITMVDSHVDEIITNLGLDAKRYSQEEAISLINDPFGSVWTTVYSYSDEVNNSISIYSCFANPSLKTTILSGQDWIKQPEGFKPGFSLCGGEASYISGMDDGYTFLIAKQHFYSLNESQLLLNQEFILLFELYRGMDGNYYKVDECGEKDCVVQFAEKQIKVKTEYLIRFMSAKQLLYVQFIDSRLSSAMYTPECSAHSELLKNEEIVNDSCNYFINYITTDTEDFLFSRICARSIVEPLSMSECGMWPFKKDEQYPEFIVEELPDGQLRKFTCEESKLANYFGANPSAPHYLTPIYFKPAVLDKYYKSPLFSVTERRIECGSEWGIEIDRIDPNRVMVFLGDLGRDLPESERFHFLTYQIPPTDQSISKEVIASDFLCLWTTEPEGPIDRFFFAYDQLKANWQKRFGHQLFRCFHSEDANIIQSIRIPTTESIEEFETIVLNLTRLLIDYIDEDQFNIIETEGSINKLEGFLKEEGFNIDLRPLRNLQKIRSSSVAHAKGKSYEKLQSQGIISGNVIQDASNLIEGLTSFINELSETLCGIQY